MTYPYGTRWNDVDRAGAEACQQRREAAAGGETCGQGVRSLGLSQAKAVTARWNPTLKGRLVIKANISAISERMFAVYTPTCSATSV